MNAFRAGRACAASVWSVWCAQQLRAIFALPMADPSAKPATLAKEAKLQNLPMGEPAASA